MMTGPVVIDLPMPPSVNRLWRIGHHGGMYLHPAYEAWKTQVGLTLVVSGRPKPRIAGPFRARIVLDASRRRGDCDNRIKAVLDALHRYRVTDDDSLCTHVSAEWGDDAPLGCRVTLEAVA